MLFAQQSASFLLSVNFLRDLERFPNVELSTPTRVSTSTPRRNTLWEYLSNAAEALRNTPG